MCFHGYNYISRNDIPPSCILSHTCPKTSYLLHPLIFICCTSSCEAKLLKPLQSGYSRMAQKRLCAYLIIQLSREPDKITTSAWSQSILLLILHILVSSFLFLLQSKAKLLFLVKAENTGKKGVVNLGTFFTSVGVEIFLVFLGPHRSTIQVENLCYVSVFYFSKKRLAYNHDRAAIVLVRCIVNPPSALETRDRKRVIVGTDRNSIRTRHLGHVTGYKPIRDLYFLIGSHNAW
eukprot:sb/3469296/